jgi:hypothetical protein
MASEYLLAELAHGPQTVKDGRLDVNEALAVLTLQGPQKRVLGQRRADSVLGGFGDGDADHAPWPYRAGSLGFFGGTSPVPPRRMLTPLPTSDGRPPQADRAKPLT